MYGSPNPLILAAQAPGPGTHPKDVQHVLYCAQSLGHAVVPRMYTALATAAVARLVGEQ